MPGFSGGSTRRRKKKRRVIHEQRTLSINSLMDVVTIILVYLIKSFATSPIEVKDPSIEVPTSTSTEGVEEATVVMVTGPVKRALDANNRPTVVPNTPTLAVDGTALFELTPVQGANGQTSWRIPDKEKTPPDSNSYVVTNLKTMLEKARETQKVAASINDREFTGKVIILADKQTPYRVMMDLLVTCGQAGFGEFKFAIVKESG